jgi:hypothetical protein
MIKYDFGIIRGTCIYLLLYVGLNFRIMITCTRVDGMVDNLRQLDIYGNVQVCVL